MARRLVYVSMLLITFMIMSAAPGQAQFGIPGGGYPGSRRYPQGGRGGQPTSNSGNSAATLVGILRKIDDKDLIVETDDGAIDTVVKSGSTKYENGKGGKATIGDFQPGDHIRVTTNQDSKKIYHAVTLSMVTEGTPEEHAAASAKTGDTTHPLIDKPPLDKSSVSSSDSNPNRPVLRRAGNAANSSGEDSPERPRLARASSAGDSPSSATNSPISPPPLYGNSASSATSDTPVLRRPPARDTTPADSARPSLHSDNPDTASRLPQRTAAPEDPFIEQARDAAFAFSETLPNYVVRQFTTRYVTGGGRGGRSSWQALDNVSADVIEEDGAEKYKNILVNGKAPMRDVEKSGSWSKGEFSSLLQDLFSPRTQADFHARRAATIVNRPAWRYEFTVEQPNSHWHVEVDSGAYMPGYSGTVWIDKENSRVLRIEMSAERMPSSFPLDQVEWAVDYDYVSIGEARFLLPVHSETLSCQRGTSQCSRNVIDFRNYRKFTADTSITFAPE